MKKRVLINVEEKATRLAVLENGELVELLIERSEGRTLVGNIYKGVVRDVIRGLNAAFVDIGLERNAFLHFDDFTHAALKPLKKSHRRSQSPPDKLKSSKHPADLLQSGANLIVQVIKDEIGTKPPRLTTHIGVAGRYLVILPLTRSQGGISRKIFHRGDRERMKKIRSIIRSDCPYGFIIRTEGTKHSENDMKRDLNYLLKQWNGILSRYRRYRSPALIYNDHDFLYRAVRDHISSDTDEIYIDSKEHHHRLSKAVKDLDPSLQNKIFDYQNTQNIFSEFGVDDQIRKILKRKVWLKSGGYVIFDELEAMAAVDVNTGKFVSRRDQEETILKTNLEAAKLIAQQLRLRDIGGLVVIDFIDMEEEKNRLRVLDEFRKHMRRDKAKISLTDFSEFGLIEMTRQRVRHSLKDNFYSDCPYCSGSGRILAREQIWLQVKYAVLKELKKSPRRSCLLVTLHPVIKSYIQQEFASHLQKLGDKHHVMIHMVPSEDLHLEEFQIFCAEKKEDVLRISQDISNK